MSLNITGQEKDVFTFGEDEDEPTGAENAAGGTELMMKWLRENVDHDLLDDFQIIPTRVRKLDPDKKKLLWIHDTASDPEVQHLKQPGVLDQFDRLVYVSHWQRQQFEWFLDIPPSKGVVMKNAIYPIEKHTKSLDGKIHVIYHTTPHRGLNILLSVWTELCKTFDNIHLDIYSSFKVYGWDHRDLDYKNLFEIADEHPNITNHGAVSNDEIRKALQTAHIFAYPSIWPETSCIAMIEAMSAGCVTVCPTYGALPETAHEFAWMYPFHEDASSHAHMFAGTLASAIQNVQNDDFQNRLFNQKEFFNTFYSWDLRKGEWTGLLKGLSNDK